MRWNDVLNDDWYFRPLSSTYRSRNNKEIELEKLVFEVANGHEPRSKRRREMLARILDEYETV